MEKGYRYYFGMAVLWTPRGLGAVSCIEKCLHSRGKFTFRKHIREIATCPYNREVSLFHRWAFKRVPLYYVCIGDKLYLGVTQWL